MEIFKYRPWNAYTEDVLANNRIFFPCKEQLNDPAELIHPIQFEHLEANQAIHNDTRKAYDHISAKFSALEAMLGDEHAHLSKDPDFHRYREAQDKHMVVLEMVYEKVEVHEALKYYVLNHVEDKVFQYDSHENIVDRLNAKLNRLGILSLARKCTVQSCGVTTRPTIPELYSSSKPTRIQHSRQVEI